MIEDVDYLKKHSEADSIAFFADSSLRDQRVFPTPAEYCVEFSQPFRNVFGFDILDAAVPTTEYNIDNYNSKLDITLIKPVNNTLYPPQTIAKKLSFSKDFSNIFERDAGSYIVLVPDTTSIVSTSPPAGELYGTYIACLETIASDAPVEQVRSIPSDYGEYYYFENNGMFLRTSVANSSIILALQEGNHFIEYHEDTSSWYLHYFQFYTVDVDEFTRIKSDPSLFIASISNHRLSIELGNYDVPNLKTELNTVYNTINVFVETTTITETKQGIFRFLSFDYMLLNGNKKNLVKNVGFDLYPSIKDTGKYSFMKIGNNPKVFTSILDTVKNTWTITAPGIVNLMGERFLILRCKEIEDHLYGSFSYSSFIPGIAMFKMGAVNDIANLRFDYVSLVRKPIHPIGKINKLTFRFETVDGRLYDFKGVNNQMLMVIKFYVPTQKYDFKQSVLNPNYDGNFIDYMSRKKTIEQHENSEDEQEFDNEDNLAFYKKQLDLHDYPSSEEDLAQDDDDCGISDDSSEAY